MNEQHKEKHIQCSWEKFCDCVIPETASDIQKSEMRRAFYAGAYSAIMVMWDVGRENVPEDIGAEIFETIKNECEVFCLLGGV